ncbi:MAG: septal ring lytic transglycosylase RlpA family lipoprotein [Gammaproteobacteria bacterium]|nr:MAG: septal ring lytic transglycosylase RlpA family lipoprotein [Gammaproteobacteria bacterium]
MHLLIPIPQIGLLFLLVATVGGLSACASDNEVEVLVSAKTAAEHTLQAESTSLTPDTSDSQSPAPVTIRHRYHYKVRGKQYKVFSDADNFQEIGMASWYGPGFHGKKTASGETYNMHAMTAAHKTLPLGTRVHVSNLENGKKIVVRINDRGPFHGGRVIDLSKKAAKRLGMLQRGFAKVHLRIAKDNEK